MPVVDFSSDSKNNNVAVDNATNRADATDTAAAAGSSSSVVDTASLMENILPGNASLTVPTTSLHLAKLALDPSEAGEFLALPCFFSLAINKYFVCCSGLSLEQISKSLSYFCLFLVMSVDAEPSRDETERQQLENEKAALLQEERRERGTFDCVCVVVFVCGCMFGVQATTIKLFVIDFHSSNPLMYLPSPIIYFIFSHQACLTCLSAAMVVTVPGAESNLTCFLLAPVASSRP